MNCLRKLKFTSASSALSIFLLSFTVVGMVRADQGALERQAHEVFGEVMSPFCPGRLLNDCPSPQAAELKQNIRTQLSQGLSTDQIFSALIDKYGEEVRATPKQSGFGLMAWVTPFLFLGAGVIAIWVWLKGSRQSSPSESAKIEIDQETRRKIEAELEQQ